MRSHYEQSGLLVVILVFMIYSLHLKESCGHDTCEINRFPTNTATNFYDAFDNDRHRVLVQLGAFVSVEQLVHIQ